MPTWIIVLAALFAAAAFEAAWLWSALAAAPGGDPASLALHRLPALALAGGALYALIALLLVAGMIALDAARVRRRLARLDAPDRRDWMEAFEGTVLDPLAVRLLDLAPLDATRGRPGIVLQGRFDAVHARREIGQAYSGRLVYAQFVTALVLLIALAALGFAHDYGGLALAPAGIPAVPATAAVVVLAVLGVLGRIVVAAAAEPLFETISRLPVERLDLALLRRLENVSQEGALRAGGSGAALSAAIGQLLERLVTALDEGRLSLIEAMASLSAQAEALAMAMRAMAERGPERGEAGADLADFHAAVAQMRALMEELATTRQLPSEIAGEGGARPGERAQAGASRSQIGREVRDLLADLE